MQELTIPSNNNYGLYPTTMRNLGQIVALIGPNGAGKSRLLSFLGTQLDEQKRARLWVAAAQRRNNAGAQPADLSPNAIEQVTSRATAGLNEAQLRQDWAQYLESLAIRLHNVTHQDANVSPEVIQAHRDRFEEARRVIKELADYELDIDVDDRGYPRATLGGRQLSPGALSDGERELLIFAVRLLAQGEFLRSIDVILDEPETHLHPGALNRMIRRLRSVVAPDGRIWLATHSLALLADLQPGEVWLLEKGKVHPPGSAQIALAIRKLFEDENLVLRLEEAVSAPSAWAASQFAAQCLSPPEVAAHREGDPQAAQIDSALQSNAASRIRVLDFGAGRGRLATIVAENPTLAGQITYFAYDQSEEHHDDRSNRVDELRTIDPEAAPQGCVLTDLTSIDDSSFDRVVLCNTLHEIPPTQWHSVISTIDRLLAPHGSLIVIEDLRLRIGERAHQFGFVVLSTEQLALLFDAETGDLTEYDHPIEQYRDRLMAVSIPASLLQNASHQAVLRAVSAMIDARRKEASNLLSSQESKDPSQARRLALCAHLVLNGTLAVEALSQASDDASQISAD